MIGDLDKYAATLFGIEITIVIFAINFSLFAYQSAPYRSLMDPISKKHLISAGIIIIVALIPIFLYIIQHDTNRVINDPSNQSIVINEGLNTLGKASFMIIPIILVLSLMLLLIVAFETKPSTILANRFKDESIKEYSTSYLHRCEIKNQEQNEFNELRGYLPRQSLAIQLNDPIILPPSHEDDLFDYLVNFGILSIKNNDADTFEKIVKQILELYKKTHTSYSGVDNNEKFLFLHADNSITWLAKATLECDKSGTFSYKFLYGIKNFVSNEVNTDIQSDLIYPLIRSMVTVSTQLLHQGTQNISNIQKFDYYKPPFIPVELTFDVIRIRLNHQPLWILNNSFAKGLYQTELWTFSQLIYTIALEAIQTESKFFYLDCAKYICWIGCYAQFENMPDLVTHCVNDLVEIGIKSNEKEEIKTYLQVIGEYKLKWGYLNSEEKESWRELLQDKFRDLLGNQYNVDIEPINGVDTIRVIVRDHIQMI